MAIRPMATAIRPTATVMVIRHIDGYPAYGYGYGSPYGYGGGYYRAYYGYAYQPSRRVRRAVYRYR